MVKLVLEISKMFHINPFVVFGLILLGYTMLGFRRNNKELHNMKDEEINRLRKEKKELSDELAMIKSIKRQVEMTYRK